ncbi:MAG: hypothetical protein AAGB16_00835 [Pseudomonadota bacterium]
MSLNPSLIKTLGRWAFAGLTSVITTFIGLYGDPFAIGQELDCGLQDVATWQSQLNEPTEEASPEYVLRVTEIFLKTCPNRPETRDAHRVAAMAAVDIDDADRALGHFDQALPLPTAQSQFYYAAALLAANQQDEAWTVRDQMIDSWAARIKRQRSVSLDETTVPGGRVYRLTYQALDDETGFRMAFIAVPDGEGWPATVTLGADRQLSAFHRLRAGADAKPLRHIDLYRCRGRRLLARSDKTLSVDDTTLAAQTSLTAYLANPDTEFGMDGDISPCLWPERLLPAPPR